MILSGIADEAAADIEGQIRAHKELGWRHIELRLVDGKNVAGELGEREFDGVCAALERESMTVTGFASRIANWSRHIRDDFAVDVEDLRLSIPRMRRLGVRHMRVMSWKGEGVPEGEWRREAVSRLRELARVAADGGVILAHENCDGWGGLSARHMLELRDAVDSPSFVLLYDLGNTVSHGLDPGEFFDIIRGQFEYVHVKDARMNPKGGRSEDFVICGRGDARIREHLRAILVDDGYDGVLAIEPHVAALVHRSGHQASPQVMYSSYLEYGRAFNELVAEADD